VVTPHASFLALDVTPQQACRGWSVDVGFARRVVVLFHQLGREFGLFVDPSSGAHLVAARALKQEHDDIEHVVTFFCDEGEKYINDYFLT
jgi:cysteine synthase